MSMPPPEQSGGPAAPSEIVGGGRRPDTPTFRNNVKWQFLASAGQAALGALVLLVMGRSIGAEGFGVFSIVFGIVYVANALGEPRMQDVAAKQFWGLHSGEEDAGRSGEFFDLLRFEVMVKAVPCLVLLAASGVVAASNNLPANGAALLAAGALGTYFSKLGYGLSMGLLRVAGRTNLFAVCAIADVGLRLVLMLGIVMTGTLSVIDAIIIQSATAFLSTLLQWIFVYRQFPKLFSNPLERGAQNYFLRIRHLWRLLGSNLALSASDLMSKDLDVALMSFFMPASNIGVYKMAKNVAMLTWRAVDPFTLSLMPEINRRFATRDYSGIRSLVSRATKALLALTLVMAACTVVGVWLFGDRVFGHEYAALPPLIGVMVLGLIISGPLVWGHPLAVALGRPDMAVTGSLAGTVLGLIAMVVLAPRFGVYGASAAWALSFVSHFVYTAYASRRLFGKEAVLSGGPPS